jgi:hypothetical protein
MIFLSKYNYFVFARTNCLPITGKQQQILPQIYKGVVNAIIFANFQL